MPMKNPPHPGAFLREEILEPLDLSTAKAASVLRVRRATLSDLLNEKAGLSAEMALRFEKAFGVSMDLLLNMQVGYDAAKARAQVRKIHVKRYHAGKRRAEVEPVP